MHLHLVLEASDWLARLDSDTFLVVLSTAFGSLFNPLTLVEERQNQLHQMCRG